MLPPHAGAAIRPARLRETSSGGGAFRASPGERQISLGPLRTVKNLAENQNPKSPAATRVEDGTF